MSANSDTDIADKDVDGLDNVVTVYLPPALLQLFPQAKGVVELSARTVGEMLDGLEVLWPGMADRLRDSSPSIRRHINVFVDGKRVTLETPLKVGARIYVLTAISGG